MDLRRKGLRTKQEAGRPHQLASLTEGVGGNDSGVTQYPQCPPTQGSMGMTKRLERWIARATRLDLRRKGLRTSVGMQMLRMLTGILMLAFNIEAGRLHQLATLFDGAGGNESVPGDAKVLVLEAEVDLVA
mmetsp:Transcript_3142/g.8203  ORF Transcript_3142/g.8203 Transcript_3142/m.8203 type:complete len:131 (-) Transcript_3142:852-1244(-)